MGNSASQGLPGVDSSSLSQHQHQHQHHPAEQSIDDVGSAKAAAYAAGVWAQKHSAVSKGLYPPGRAKVLPERVPGQRLRITDNGAILHQGGTISGRRQTTALTLYNENEEVNYRPRSGSHHASSRFRSDFPSQVKRFGSEPDLRISPEDSAHSHMNQHNRDYASKLKINRTRKKYKAPAPPPGTFDYSHPQSSSPDSLAWAAVDGVGVGATKPTRHRLFKTKAETSNSAQQHRRVASDAGAKFRHLETTEQAIPRVKPPSNNNINHKQQHLERSISTPDFQISDNELIHAAQKLKSSATKKSADTSKLSRQKPLGEREAPIGAYKNHLEKEPQQQHHQPPAAPPTTTTKPTEQKQKHWQILESSTRNVSSADVPKTKTFYFGMDSSENEAVDRFAATFRNGPQPAPAVVGSDSSEPDASEDVKTEVGSIALNLRPTLPKKQLEIPRFSPTTAWKLLSNMDPNQTLDSGTASHGDAAEAEDALSEIRIERLSRPLVPAAAASLAVAARRSNGTHDKSGDSGISGDPPSPPGRPPPSAEQMPPVAWTPQQDLEDEDVSDSSDPEASSQLPVGIGPPKFSPRPHVFSLSLPRDDRLCLAMYDHSGNREMETTFNSLKKIKRALVGGGGDGTGNGESLDSNWVLSRSVPTSLNKGQLLQEFLFESGGRRSPSTPETHSYFAQGGHVMYLPISSSSQLPRNYSSVSKSCDNIIRTTQTHEMRQLSRSPSPELLGIRTKPPLDQPHLNQLNHHNHHNYHNLNHHHLITKSPPSTTTTVSASKPKRFTFQSTMRQIERRRLAERLSREAEAKERQRLGELEVMRRVEEEFQKKRANEKASIRNQLRIFHMEETVPSFTSLPWDGSSPGRAEPDGAPSSSPTNSSMAGGGGGKLQQTRGQTREYRDYRPSIGICPSGTESLPTTVHPQAVFDIPRSTQVYVSPTTKRVSRETPSSGDNYRKGFAQGTPSTRPSKHLHMHLQATYSSDSDGSQPHLKGYPHTHQIHHHPHSRSESPDNDESDEIPEETNNDDEISTLKRASSERLDRSRDRLQQQQQQEQEQQPLQQLTGVRPFERTSKVYRPIVFNPPPPTQNNINAEQNKMLN